LRAICQSQSRRCDLVHSEARALLSSDLDPVAYYEATVRGKKRKELRRQAKRLNDLGDVQFVCHDNATGLDDWIAEFLALEQAGWKGQNGSALNSIPETKEFFQDILRGAAASGQLQRHDVRLEGAPLAMLVNFHSSPGSFSFKTAFNEDYSRFSPGVLLQIENLDILKNRRVQWMDSCAAEDHPMIDSLWSERRHIGRFSIELSGVTRKTMFRGVRIGEDLMAKAKGRTVFDPMHTN
jgi:CelD/BcsL family acetyltransferase involved in cellulose biosynthesis